MSAAELVMAAAVIARHPKELSTQTLPWSQRLTSGDRPLMVECVWQFARTLENAPPPGSPHFAVLHRELTATFSRMLNPQLLLASLVAVRNATKGIVIGDAIEKGLSSSCRPRPRLRRRGARTRLTPMSVARHFTPLRVYWFQCRVVAGPLSLFSAVVEPR